MQFEIGIVTWICCMQHLYRPEYMFYTCFIFNKPIVWTIEPKVTDRYFFSISMHYIVYLKHVTLFMFLYISFVIFFYSSDKQFLNNYHITLTYQISYIAKKSYDVYWNNKLCYCVSQLKISRLFNWWLSEVQLIFNWWQ